MSSFHYNVVIDKDISDVIEKIAGKKPVSLKHNKYFMIIYIKYEDGTEATVNIVTGMKMRDQNFVKLYELLAY